MVRAKFKCNEVTKQIGWNGNEFVYSFKLRPVTGDTEENKKFFAATPGGDVTLTVIRDDFFEVGQEYYLDFSPADGA